MKKYLPAIILVILGITTRFLPHLPNFTAVGAVAIFAGIYLPKKYAFWLPVFIMVLSDIILGFYSYPIMAAVYGCFLVNSYLGYKIGQNKKISTVIGGTLLGNVFFFLITNWAVWAFGTMYTPTLTGLGLSYYFALPFWRNQIMGDLVYIVLLAGSYEVVINLLKAKTTLPEKI